MTRIVEFQHAQPGDVVDAVSHDGQVSMYTLPEWARVTHRTDVSSHPTTGGKRAIVLDVRYDNGTTDRWLAPTNTPMLLRVLTPKDVEREEKAEAEARLAALGTPPTFMDLLTNEPLLAYSDVYANFAMEEGPDSLVDRDSEIVLEALSDAGLEYDEVWDTLEGWSEVEDRASAALWLDHVASRLAAYLNQANSDPENWGVTGPALWGHFAAVVQERCENGA